MKLGEVCTVVSGTTPSTNISEYWNGAINWITPAELSDDSFIIYESERKITETAVKKSGLSSFPAGTVLLTSRAPIGKVAIAGVEMYCNQGFKNLICSKYIYNEYLFWFLKGNSKFLNSLGRGATFKEISKSIVENIDIPLPDIEEQHEIANAFKKLSYVIAMRKKQLQKLDDLVKARFVEMFGDPKYNKNNLVKIGEIGALTSGGTPSRAKPEYFEGAIRWYSAGELNSLYLADSIEHISETALQESSAKLFNKGTLLIGMYDTAAFKMGILTENASSNQACANLNPNQGYNIVWLYYLFDMMKPIFLKERQGVRQKNLSLSKIKEFEIPIAPFELQEEFAAFVKQTDKSKLTIQQSLDKLELMKKALMQKYFG